MLANVVDRRINHRDNVFNTGERKWIKLVQGIGNIVSMSHKGGVICIAITDTTGQTISVSLGE